MTRLAADRQFWIHASGFPPDKTVVYPDHARVQHLAEVAGKRVLEYGCGGGADAMSYLKAGAEHVTLVDIVPDNLETSRRRIEELLGPRMLARAQFWWLTASDALPPADVTYDVINSHGVLHHIEEPMMHVVLRALHARLRPTGWATFMLYTEHLRQRCDWIIAPRLEQGWAEDAAFGSCTDGDGCIARHYTEAAGREVIERAGFRIEDVQVYNCGDFRTFYCRRP